MSLNEELKKLQGRGYASGFWFNAGGESSAQVNITEDGNVVVKNGVIKDYVWGKTQVVRPEYDLSFETYL